MKLLLSNFVRVMRDKVIATGSTRKFFLFLQHVDFADYRSFFRSRQKIPARLQRESKQKSHEKEVRYKGSCDSY